jgi:hypothetical protein
MHNSGLREINRANVHRPKFPENILIYNVGGAAHPY